ncbi:decaprenyl-phosphate phosphoribosyltransferase [Candidatus Desantisbacteria bacterium CG2_30_40_21]|uniref:Decaprenyl-phosphate phosphoribosyltransferase n=5 Tax=unclassified Candidatus Desantisiibacteriota TaxID=3106372 RepID=A0A2M7JD17_9BACT|nr:MAG: decaprenyl-phosphate phosphoribosyltransferase [Candidatus Desantisbacteria bacterium CG2_30_40_21]PIP41092.1 MAG: decaprenyl-phosphate phosphoribosyltransferase [Candidatus Desantisbacteria bacterium CG23_combo_of_CG06-09_8_20_14_all_40_23]PIX17281.1 MAG: decaprenyl-phosphate phosphoribosyltransferase [Candidatus Desantisbacteria bacterium CG_4_8_14_3_um_filter_40_12]PIY18540.1 MAG: decaprenyl-phosphate phosphoribosyltransferase [Candidatus Desantisbacteria bacterium CG_4_10_14_3_um_fil
MLGLLFESMRPKQWTKNLIVFAAIIFAQELGSMSILLKVIGGFVIFSLLSGCGYIFNDLSDMEKDKIHPRKQNRPIASGRLNPLFARYSAILIIILSLIGAFILGINFGIISLGYLLLTLGYSFFFKHIVILDVMVLSFGFVLRAVAGAVVSDLEISPWLVICTMLLALFLGLGKRRHELVLLEATASSHRAILREYTPAFIDEMISAVTGSTIIAYSLYAFSPEVQDKLCTPYLPLTIPFVLYGIFRYLYLVHQKGGGGSPESDILRDKPLLMAILLWIVVVMVIIYL